MVGYVRAGYGVHSEMVEELTEFLPASSTGHMILVGSLLGFTDDKVKIKIIEVIIQLWSILAVTIMLGVPRNLNFYKGLPCLA